MLGLPNADAQKATAPPEAPTVPGAALPLKQTTAAPPEAGARMSPKPKPAQRVIQHGASLKTPSRVSRQL